jgi:Na+-transporting methylmalonyl-CoA/oxaloacetate decarboxylase gamma subunit
MIEMTSSIPALGYVVVVLPLLILLVWGIRSVLIARDVEEERESDEQ